MQLWNNLFLISVVLFVVIVVLLNVFKFRKNYYAKPYNDDELFDSKNENGVKSYYHFTSIETRKYIKRYVFRKSPYQRNVICNFVDNYKMISYFIVAYSKKKKVIDVVEVTEKPYGLSSRVISVNKKAEYVNVFVKRVDGVDVNTNIIRPLPVRKIKYFTALSALALFAGLFALRHLFIVIIGGLHAKDYLNNFWNYIAVGVTFVISLLYWIFTTISLRKRNHQNRRGGTNEYEFF